jgi:ABC-2 type transport system ATP-binding protein
MNVILCSHLLKDVEEVCDEAIILHEGRLVHHSDLEAERRSNRRFVELEVTGDDGNLAAALRAHGSDGVTEGCGRWRIVLPAGVELSELWALLARENLGVHKLTHRRDTLEEIFLKAVGHIRETPGDEARRQEVATHGHL